MPDTRLSQCFTREQLDYIIDLMYISDLKEVLEDGIKTFKCELNKVPEDEVEDVESELEECIELLKIVESYK